MTSYNRYNQDAQGRRVWPIPGFPINSDTFDSGWWVWSTGTNWTIGSNMHNELRFGIQHSGDTNEVGRQAEFFDLNGILNGKAARFGTGGTAGLPLSVSLLVADNAPVIGRHYITTITDTLTMVKGNHTFKVGGNYRDTQWRDRSLDGSGTGGYLGLPRYWPRHRDGRSGRECLHDHDDARSGQRGSDGGAIAVCTAHRPRDGSAHRRRHRSGHAAVPRRRSSARTGRPRGSPASLCRTCGE